MAPFIRNLLTGLILCALGGSCPRSAMAPPEPPARPGDTADDETRHAIQCRDWREETEDWRYRAMQRSQAAFMGRLKRGGADPERDAADAARRGEFGLVMAMAMSGTSPFGVECRALEAPGAPRMTLAKRVYSDVIGSCETAGATCALEEVIDRYAPLYNRALVSQPSYPYRDICRPRGEAEPLPPVYRDPDPANFGFADLESTDAPHDLHEAARRGSPTSVERLIARQPARIDETDPFGLTPLAWAVIRRRPDVAARLAAAGADPIAPGCRQPTDSTSPLRLALRTGQEALALRFLTPSAVKRLTPWPGGLLEAAARGGSADMLARMLREPHGGGRLNGIRGHEVDALSPAVLTVIERHMAGLCWKGPLKRGTMVRMVGAYRSSNAVARPYGHEIGPIRIKVKASAGPVLLVASAHEPVDWRIELAPGARLVGVVATGSYRPVVSGDIRGAQIVTNDREDRCDQLLSGPTHVYEPGERQQAMAEAVGRMLGAQVADFQSRHSAGEFTIE